MCKKWLLLAVMLFAPIASLHAADEENRSGLIFARVAVEDGVALVESVRSSLPESVIKQLHGTISKRALQEARRLDTDDGEFAVGIEWHLVKKDERDQLAFDFSTAEARAIKAVIPELPRSMLSINEPISANVRLGISALGEVTLEDCQVAEARFRDACKNISKALKDAEFLPKFEAGIGVPAKISQALKFEPPR